MLFTLDPLSASLSLRGMMLKINTSFVVGLMLFASSKVFSAIASGASSIFRLFVLQCIMIRSGLLLTVGIAWWDMQSNLATGNDLTVTFCLKFLLNFRPCILFTIESSSTTVVFLFLFSSDCPATVFTVTFSFAVWWKVVSENSLKLSSISLAVAKAWKKIFNLILFVSLLLLIFWGNLKVLLYGIKMSLEGKLHLLLFTSTLYCISLSSLLQRSRFSFSSRFCITMLLFLLSSSKKSISSFSIAAVSWLHDAFPKLLRTFTESIFFYIF